MKIPNINRSTKTLFMNFIKKSLIAFSILSIAYMIYIPILELAKCKSHTIYSYYENTMSESNLKLDNIEITGNKIISEQEIIKLINIDSGMYINEVKPFNLEYKIRNNIPWIKDINVDVRLPHTLKINITEYKPRIIWQKKEGEYFIISEENVIIPIDNKNKFVPLVEITGVIANLYINDLLQKLYNFPEIYNHTKIIHMARKNRWDVVLQNEITIKLPENNKIQDALQYITKQNEKTNFLFSPQTNIEQIDLRLGDRTFIKKRAKRPIHT